ncbi:MAG: alpha/beta fold hydrolase [Terriglobia bacterium]
MRTGMGVQKRVGLLMMAVISLVLFGQQAWALKKKEPPTKTIRGQVVDRENQAVAGAKVFIQNTSKNTTTVLVSDESGVFSIYGLDTKIDYIVHAESRNLSSEKMTVSRYLNRLDNYFTLALINPIKVGTAKASVGPVTLEVELEAANGFRLKGDWYAPSGGKEKAPAILLIHGFGRDRHVWDTFIQSYLLPKGFGVLNLDLSGHGKSTSKGAEIVQVQPSWVSDPNQFPADITAAVKWLKAKPEIDTSRIACIGESLGADLAYFASGKFEEIRTAVALSPMAESALGWANGIQNFQPHSVLYVAAQGDPPSTDASRRLESQTGFPVQVRIISNSSLKGAQLVSETPEVAQIVVDWILKNM